MLAVAPVKPPFVARVSAVTRSQLRYSYRPGCPVGPAQLRSLRVRYFGFDNRAHVGVLIVNASVTRAEFRADATTKWPAASAAFAKSTPIPRLAPVINQIFFLLMPCPSFADPITRGHSRQRNAFHVCTPLFVQRTSRLGN